MDKDNGEIKVVVGDDNLATLICPECNFLSVEDVSEYKNSNRIVNKVCKCGHTYSIVLEKRKFYRKASRIQGICTPVSHDISITVIDLSLTGLKFKVNKKHDFKVGDELYVEFELDDKKKSVIVKKVIIKSIDEQYIGTEFIRPDQYSEIKPYIYFQ